MTSILPQLLLIEMPGGGELLIILVVVLLLFGGKKIPELMRGLGKGIREFNDAKGKITSELEEGIREKDSRPAGGTSYKDSETIPPAAASSYKETHSGTSYQPDNETAHSRSTYLPETETGVRSSESPYNAETTLPTQLNGKL